jgi:secreted trypsin-like serine protease
LRKLIALSVLVMAIAAIGAAPGGAITYGQPDTTNRYPYVGALVGTFGDQTYPYCSGTLISPTVFLTAAHCDLGTGTACVTFDAQYTSRSKLFCGEFIAHPDYGRTQSNPNDVAVVVFDKPIRGIQPAQIAEEGLLDQMLADGTLNQTTAFTSVGYGGQEPGHKNAITYLDRREYAVGYFNALGPGYLRLSQNQATGSGGTCYGDSGGPVFLGNTNIVVAIVTTGDAVCKSTNVDQRIDIPSVQEFLALYV